MTEAEWLACDDSYDMLASVPGKGSDRKFRLFAVACCERIWHLIPTEPSRHCVEVARRLADGLVKPGERRAPAQAAMGDAGTTAAAACVGAASAYEAAVRTADHATRAVARARFPAHRDGWERELEWLEIKCSECLAQSALLRDIVGNPFRSITFFPVWRTDTVVSLARGMYESRDFSAMPILADALEDAGCGSDDILNHRRGDGPHVRGCWVVDLVLGKS